MSTFNAYLINPFGNIADLNKLIKPKSPTRLHPKPESKRSPVNNAATNKQSNNHRSQVTNHLE